MTSPRAPRRRLASRLVAAALALATIAPLATAVPAPGAGTEAEGPAENRLREHRERLEDTSARLAQARIAAQSVGGAERAALRRSEARLRVEKDELVARDAALARRAERERAEMDRAATAALAADDAEVREAAEAAEAALLTPVFTPPPAAVVPGAAPVVVPGVGTDVAMVALIDGYLASKQSPMTGLGAVFVSESHAAGLDPRFLVAIAGAETSFGTYGPSQTIQNPFGMGPGIAYSSWSEAIGAAARNLTGGYYLGEGRLTIAAIQQRWAPNGAANDPTGLNSHWTRNVSTYYAALGGDPLAPVFRLAPATPAV